MNALDLIITYCIHELKYYIHHIHMFNCILIQEKNKTSEK